MAYCTLISLHDKPQFREVRGISTIGAMQKLHVTIQTWSPDGEDLRV